MALAMLGEEQFGPAGALVEIKDMSMVLQLKAIDSSKSGRPSFDISSKDLEGKRTSVNVERSHSTKGGVEIYLQEFTESYDRDQAKR